MTPRKPYSFCSNGEKVFLAGHDIQGLLLDTIDRGKTYDVPSKVKPLSTGYIHDLKSVEPGDSFLDL